MWESDSIITACTHPHVCRDSSLLFLFSDASKLQNPSRKQSVSRSLKHLFNSSSKFVKTLKRFVMHLNAVLMNPSSWFAGSLIVCV